jgi:hypothetical protein
MHRIAAERAGCVRPGSFATDARLVPVSYDVRSTPKADIRSQRSICRDGPIGDIQAAVGYDCARDGAQVRGARS